MDLLVRMLGSRKFTLSNPSDTSSALPQMNSPAAPTLPDTKPSPLTALPTEIIYEIFSLLPPLSLVRLTRTSKFLRTHALTDSLWARFVRENVPSRQDLQCYPAESWRELYISLHPYWFLAKNKLWFSDKAHTGSNLTGSLVLARYDSRRGCIEGVRLLAKQGIHSFESWEWDHQVIIHTFNPEVSLHVDDPVVKIDGGMYAERNSVKEEILMNTGYTRGVRSKLSLCHALTPQEQNEYMALWPPRIIPAKERVRNDSQQLFSGTGHRPSSLLDVSENTFRIRKWVEFGGMGAPLGIHIGEDIMTFSTVPEEYYTPTKEKPWQGIWVGDYSGHGCEFLLLIQSAVDKSSSGPKASFETPLQHHFDGSDLQGRRSLPVEKGEDGSSAGRLEAIKLTGDPNVPRGEYTWVAEDIGSGGLLRVAGEKMFKGARVVKSLGHCAARDFRDGKHFHSSVGLTMTDLPTDQFIPAQLIVVDHDTLAQYWQVRLMLFVLPIFRIDLSTGFWSRLVLSESRYRSVSTEPGRSSSRTTTMSPAATLTICMNPR